MTLRQKIVKPVWSLLGVAGVNVASIATFTSVFSKSGGCTGNCGSCGGLSCVSGLVGVAVSGTVLIAIKKLRIVSFISKIFAKKTS
jgi:hypothetical protein